MLKLHALQKRRCVPIVGRVRLLEISILTIFVVLMSSASFAQTDSERITFDIPSQSVPQALDLFSRQANVVLGFSEPGYEGVQTRAVIGSFRRERALEMILTGTGLRVTIGTGDTVIVRRASDTASPIAGSAAALESDSLLAQVAATGKGATFSADNSTNTQDRPSATTGGNAATEGSQPFDEIIVTGTHIRGVDSVGAAAITFTREEIQKTGYSTVEELIRSLPQNLADISADAITADGTSALATGNTVGASGISLRGLGPGSTLVLLNGKRRPGNVTGRVFDVSAIPLSMVERVEVVTGGRSAIYGSDAVAGVVNIVTHTELDGAETQVYYGEAPAGGERVNFSQTFGRNFDRGGFVFGYDYRKDQELDLTETGVVRAPGTGGSTPIPGLYYLQHPSEQHVGLFAGHLELNDNVELYGDAHFSADENEVGFASNFSDFGFDFGQVINTESDQYSVVAGVRLDVGTDWQVDVAALHGVVDNTSAFAQPFVFAPETITNLNLPPNHQRDENEAKLTSFSAIADGPLGTMGGGTISGAIGIEFRDESYENTRVAIPAGTRTSTENRDRDVWSIFGEIHLPLVDRDGHRLEVSLAGRYDDYSDFGDTFNPQLGVDWEPVSGLTLRGSYSQAYRAPDLFTLEFANFAQLAPVPDPTLPPGGMTTTLGGFGGNPDLQPEEADTWTVGVDWEPSDRTKISLSYFNIEYKGRIEEPEPALSFVLTNESFFPGLINRSPTAEEVAEVLARIDLATFQNFTGVPLDPATDDLLALFPGLAIFDGRNTNIAIEEVDGIDFQASTLLQTGSGDWSFDFNGTHYFDFKRNITPTSPSIDQLNQPGKLVDLKLRAGIGWSRSVWNANAYVNYVDSYEDTNAATPTKIDSWTTVDLILRYNASEITDGGFLDGVQVTLAFNNLFDEDPPEYLSHAFGLGYDPVNADPFGRFTSLRLSKSW